MSRQEIQHKVDDENGIEGALEWVREMLSKGLQRGAVVISLGRPRRTKDQNAKLWPMLNDIARQRQYPVIDRDTGEEKWVWLEPEDWKDIFTAALYQPRLVPGIEGGFVALGKRTSKMDKFEFSDLIELIYWYGSEHNINWSEPAKQTYEKYRKAA